MTVRDRLEDRAERDGREWAAAVRSRLRQQGRAAVGGWPGTVSEARARMTRALRDSSPPPDELTRLARILYHTARQTWLDGCDPRVRGE